MTCPASSKFRRYSRMIAVTIAGMLRGSATLLNLWKQQLGRTEFSCTSILPSFASRTPEDEPGLARLSRCAEHVQQCRNHGLRLLVREEVSGAFNDPLVDEIGHEPHLSVNLIST